uniref:Uncharacterized protein LOC112807765 n=1 Tax=Callorhinus ursinus TaxID=34884 RepID=A0A3Q7MIB1_CALUR|nr:uncharacterized protein LOC112807765 [Callorhinus ursinus]XP_025706625.1 uncharacterized protein LOC112807884 [Callorhinus ursinus]
MKPSNKNHKRATRSYVRGRRRSEPGALSPALAVHGRARGRTRGGGSSSVKELILITWIGAAGGGVAPARGSGGVCSPQGRPPGRGSPGGRPQVKSSPQAPPQVGPAGATEGSLQVKELTWRPAPLGDRGRGRRTVAAAGPGSRAAPPRETGPRTPSARRRRRGGAGRRARQASPAERRGASPIGGDGCALEARAAQPAARSVSVSHGAAAQSRRCGGGRARGAGARLSRPSERDPAAETTEAEATRSRRRRRREEPEPPGMFSGARARSSRRRGGGGGAGGRGRLCAGAAAAPPPSASESQAAAGGVACSRQLHLEGSAFLLGVGPAGVAAGHPPGRGPERWAAGQEHRSESPFHLRKKEMPFGRTQD